MSLKHAILVLLEKEPGSGYDLAQRFKRGIGHFWNASHQQIYQELKKLDAEECVHCKHTPQLGKPDRKVYRLSAKGLRALRQWMQEPEAPPVVRDALLIKIFGAHLGDADTLARELRRHVVLHQTALDSHLAEEARYWAQPAAKRKALLAPYLTLRMGIRYERQWLEWLLEVEAVMVAGQALPMPDGSPSPRHRK